MSKQVLKSLCRREELYETPKLNEKLYLNHQGFTKIENLEEYTELRAIWLNNNGLERIEGLDN